MGLSPVYGDVYSDEVDERRWCGDEVDERRWCEEESVDIDECRWGCLLLFTSMVLFFSADVNVWYSPKISNKKTIRMVCKRTLSQLMMDGFNAHAPYKILKTTSRP